MKAVFHKCLSLYGWDVLSFVTSSLRSSPFSVQSYSASIHRSCIKLINCFAGCIAMPIRIFVNIFTRTVEVRVFNFKQFDFNFHLLLILRRSFLFEKLLKHVAHVCLINPVRIF